jgi:N-acetylneuraminic acid mutarotase
LVNLPSIVTATEDSWTSLEPLPDEVSIVKAVEVMGKIYAITGQTIFEYDVDLNNWSRKTSVPSPRESNSFGVAVCKNKIYVIGGLWKYKYLSANEVYDPLSDSWQTKEDLPTNRGYIEVNVVEDKIYVISGETQSGSPNVNEVYDPITNSWSTKQPIPSPIIKGTSVVVDSKIYILGGLYEFNADINARYNQIYDTQTDQWTEGAPLPIPMWYTAAGATTGAKADKRIYIMGGGLDQLIGEVYMYVPELDSWTSGNPMPTVRAGHSIVVIDDELYVVGGADGWHGEQPPLVPGSGGWNLTNRVDKYTPLGYIPEFPSSIILPLFLTATLFVIVCRTRMNKINRKKE